MFHRNTFIGRIATVMTLFALVPMLFLLATLLDYRTSTLNAATYGKAQSDAESFANECERLCYKIENIAQTLGSDQILIKTSKQFRRGATLGQEIDIYTDLRNVISLTLTNDEVKKLKLYLPPSNLVTHQKVTIFSLDDIEEGMLPEAMRDGRILSGWTLGKGGNPVYYYRSVYSRLSEFVLSLEISDARLKTVVEKIGLDGRFRIYTGDKLLWTYGEASADAYEQTLNAGSWTVHVALPLSRYSNVGEYPFTMLLVLFGIILLMIPALAYAISKPISRTINRLVEVNRALTRQEFTKTEEDSTISELRILQQSHNIMTDSIRQLIQNVYEAQHERDQTEINSLFEQVKPHFLYNTLEGGKWLAKREGAEKTAQFLETLAVFYRVGLSKGDAFIPLRHELEHITEYVKLMNMRYSDAIDLVIDAPVDMDNVYVLRLILQPLVENAIEHGLHGIAEYGRVEISVREQDGNLIFTVTDNGSGLTAEECERINGGKGGYGLSNVQRRLRVYYKDRASMAISVLDDGGACVRIYTPLYPD
ncbi:MAG: sensor histidine kinase [Christensenellales bacterium]|jgi:sensor histidine kinase YesM